MSDTYVIDNTEGTLSFKILPGTLDGPGGIARNTDLYLYGQKSIKWGEGVLKNLVKITENFACPEKEVTDPGYVVGVPRPKDETDLGTGLGITTPINGQLWYNNTTKVLYTYDLANDVWRTSAGMYIDTAPTSPSLGDLSYNSNFHAPGVAQLTIYDGVSFISTAQEYVRLAGDTMTGDLGMGGNNIQGLALPVLTGDAVNKLYADGTFVDVAGDSMSGFLTLSADPTANMHAVTKQYADNTFVDVAGDTMAGELNMSANAIRNVADPVVDLTTNMQDVATKNYIINLVLGAIYTVGSYFLGPNPNGKLPGAWTQLPAGTFLMASGGGNGTTGGQNTKTLSEAEMPTHTHPKSISSAGGHQHFLNKDSACGGGTARWSSGPNINHGPCTIGMIGGYNNSNNVTTTFAGSHAHSLTINNTGLSQPFDMRPQYEDVEVWKRIS